MACTMEPQVQVSSACSPWVLFRPLAEFEIWISSSINLHSGHSRGRLYMQLVPSLLFIFAQVPQGATEGWRGMRPHNRQLSNRDESFSCRTMSLPRKVLSVSWGDIDIPDCQVLLIHCHKHKTIYLSSLSGAENYLALVTSNHFRFFVVVVILLLLMEQYQNSCEWNHDMDLWTNELTALKSVCIIHSTTILIDDLSLLVELLFISSCLNSKAGHQICIIVSSYPV